MAFAGLTVIGLLGWMYCKCYGLTWLLVPAIPSGVCLVVLFLIAESTGR
jgi:hypothetical protein